MSCVGCVSLESAIIAAWLKWWVGRPMQAELDGGSELRLGVTEVASRKEGVGDEEWGMWLSVLIVLWEGRSR